MQILRCTHNYRMLYPIQGLFKHNLFTGVLDVPGLSHTMSCMCTYMTAYIFQHWNSDSAPFSLHIRYSVVFYSASYVFIDSLHTCAFLTVSCLPIVLDQQSCQLANFDTAGVRCFAYIMACHIYDIIIILCVK